MMDDDSDDRGDIKDADKLSVNLDDLQSGDDSDEPVDLAKLQSLGYNGSDSTNSGVKDMFRVGESKDKGLAEMETGSEVYMSELLAGFDMDEIEDADEANEEDLLELADEFAQIKIPLVQHIKNTI